MNNKATIKVITEKRLDAIHIYTESLIQNLPRVGAGIDVILLDNTRFKSPLLNFIIEVINTVRILFMVHQDDIMLFTDPLSFNTLASLFLKNKKYILFFHYEKDPFYYKYLPFLSYKRALNGFNGIIYSSQFSISQLSSLGVDTEKCKIIYCGIDHALFKPSQIKPYSFDYILAVGSEEPRKNMKNIIAAFQIISKDFPQLKLLKVGSASPKNRKQTMDYIKKYQLHDSVVFTDFIEKEQLPQVYSGAKLLLFPSLLEGFGLPIIEAMACGCPVVTSNRSPMTELVGSGQITIDPINTKEIAQACKNILLDNKYRDSIISNGLMRAKFFDWKKTADEVYDFITSSQ